MRRITSVSLVLLISLVLACPLSAQESGPPGSSGGTSGFQIEQNYPNPFNPETTIPFVLGEDLFVSGQPVVVSIHIYNILQQEVARPVAKNHPLGEVRVDGIEYTAPGRYEAWWDGLDRSGRQVASGVYLVRLTVNGQHKLMKMYVAK